MNDYAQILPLIHAALPYTQAVLRKARFGSILEVHVRGFYMGKELNVAMAVEHYGTSYEGHAIYPGVPLEELAKRVVRQWNNYISEAVWQNALSNSQRT